MLAHSAILDREICRLNPDGTSNFMGQHEAGLPSAAFVSSAFQTCAERAQSRPAASLGTGGCG